MKGNTDYRSKAQILTTLICLTFTFPFFFFFLDKVVTTKESDYYIYLVLLIIFSNLFFYIWKSIYRQLCHYFSKNIPQEELKIDELLQSKIQFVLFLRPFIYDDKLNHYTIDVLTLPWQGFTKRVLTLEEQLADVFKADNYKVVGIASNVSKKNYLGSERFLSDEMTWKENVSQLIKKSEYICFFGNGTGEYQWEIDEVHNLNCIEKSIIFYPNNEDQYRIFKESFKKYPIISTIVNHNLINKSDVFGGALYYDKSEFGFVHFPFTNSSRDDQIGENMRRFMIVLHQSRMRQKQKISTHFNAIVV